MTTMKVNQPSKPQNMRLSVRAEQILDAIADDLGLNRRGAVETAARFLARLREESGRPYNELLLQDKVDFTRKAM